MITFHEHSWGDIEVGFNGEHFGWITSTGENNEHALTLSPASDTLNAGHLTQLLEKLNELNNQEREA